MKIISIEGNIGSGKSTFFRFLENYYKDDPKIIFLDEPVSLWESIKDTDGENILSKFYKDQTKYSFQFQIMAYITRLSLLRKISKEKDIIVITERCLYSDYYIFAKMLYDQNKMTEIEYQIYMKWFYEFEEEFKVYRMFYISVNPDLCFERIKQRSRGGEDSISLDYLEQCDRYHEEMINIMSKKISCLTIHANMHITNDQYKYWAVLLFDQCT